MLSVDAKRQQKPNTWKEYFIYNFTKDLTPGAGNQFDTILTRIDSDADFEFIKLTYTATSDKIKLKIKDEAAGRYLLKTPTDIKAIAGRNDITSGESSAFLPFILPKPFNIIAANNFTVEAADYSGVANTMRLAIHGNKVRSGRSPYDKPYRAQIPYVTGLLNGAVTIPANGTVTQTIEVDIDADFLVHKITGIRTGDALVNISQDSRGRDWMNAPIHVDNFMGNGAFPNVLPSPRFINRGSVVVINITDISGAPNTVDIYFSGLKMYV